MKTIKELLRGQTTIEQYRILERADIRFAPTVGRFYSGPLTDEDVEFLCPSKQEQTHAGTH